MRCQNCGEDLSLSPLEAVENTDPEKEKYNVPVPMLDEVVARKVRLPEHELSLCYTDFFCDAECFVNWFKQETQR